MNAALYQQRKADANYQAIVGVYNQYITVSPAAARFQTMKMLTEQYKLIDQQAAAWVDEIEEYRKHENGSNGNGLITGPVTLYADQPAAEAVANSANSYMLNWALWAASKGWKIFPCDAGGKEPAGEAVPRGVVDASSDVEQIKQWWAKNPNYNYGINLDTSNLVAFDFDAATPEEYEALTKNLPDTFMVRSGRILKDGQAGGVHRYFSGKCHTHSMFVPPVLPLTEETSVDAKTGRTITKTFDAHHRLVGKRGVTVGEVRSCPNSYVIGPGSIHKSGQPYTITNDVVCASSPEQNSEEPRSTSEPIATDEQNSIADYVEAAMSEAHVHFVSRKGYKGGFMWLVDCPWTDEHSGGKNIDQGGSSSAVFMHQSGGLNYTCQHAHCEDREWAEFRAYMENTVGHRLIFRDDVDDPNAVLKFNQSETINATGQAGQAGQVQPTDLFVGLPRSYDPWEYALKPLYGLKFTGWFPMGRITLMSGSSGAMKTTFLAQALVAARRGEIFLGHEGAGLPFYFMFADRGKWDCEETFQRMNLEGEVPYKSINNVSPQLAAKAIAEEAATGKYKVIVIDGGDLIVEDNNEGKAVGNFNVMIQQIAEHYGVAIVITTGANKMSAQNLKQGAERRTITKGSEVWGRMGGSLFTMNSEHDGTQDTRRLVIQHRNAPTERFLLKVIQGRLVAVDEVKVSEESQTQAILDWLMTRESFTLAEITRKFKWSGTVARTKLEALTKVGTIKPGGASKRGGARYVVPDVIKAFEESNAKSKKASKIPRVVDLSAVDGDDGVADYSTYSSDSTGNGNDYEDTVRDTSGNAQEAQEAIEQEVDEQ